MTTKKKKITKMRADRLNNKYEIDAQAAMVQGFSVAFKMFANTIVKYIFSHRDEIMQLYMKDQLPPEGPQTDEELEQWANIVDLGPKKG